MTIIKFIILALIFSLLIVFLKSTKSQFVAYIIIAAEVVLIGIALNYAKSSFAAMSEIFSKTKAPSEVIKFCFKLIGLAYLTEFSANLVKDIGQNGISEKVRLFGKISIFVASLPMVKKFIEICAVML